MAKEAKAKEEKSKAKTKEERNKRQVQMIDLLEQVIYGISGASVGSVAGYLAMKIYFRGKRK